MPDAPVEITVTPLAPVLGALPIVTDQFATVTVVPNEELRRTPSATLGDLLFAKPGITGSSFAPGAASRPVIRGLDVNRVGITENGIGAGGVSDLGEDHFVPVMPLATGQVEVIRGPATLRYGSQSIGGVVSATNNRIPERLPCPAPCVTGAMRGAATTVDNGLEGGVLIDAAAGNVAVHVDAFGRKADDYRIPSYPYLFVPGLPFNGRQPNSAARADTQSAGASYIFNEGFVGLAVTQSGRALPHTRHRWLSAQHAHRCAETKVTSKGEYRPQAGGIDAVRFWLGATDYKHNELGLADPADTFSDGVRQTFTSKEQEGRVECIVPAVQSALRHADDGAWAPGRPASADRAGRSPGPFSGLFAPNDNRRAAGYVFNEFKFSDWTRAQTRAASSP